MTGRIPTRNYALLLATFMALCACGRNQNQPVQSGPGSFADIDQLSDAEKRYGMGATRNPNVTLQPDVVLMPDGPKAVREQGANGFTWTIDPDAKGADEIKPGKILLLTSRAAGRVLHAQRTERGLEVILGPADITEFIRDGEFHLDQPVNLEKMLEYQMPEIFDPVMPVAPIIASTGQFTTTLASFARPQTNLGDQSFRMFNLNGSDGFGLEIASREGTAMYLGQVKFYLSSPSLKFDLDIKDGAIKTALVELRGAAGFGLAFEAGLPSPTTTNISAQRFAPVDFTIPVVPMGMPFAVNIRQQVRLQTAFTGTGTVKARLRYELRGNLKVGYENSKWGLWGPTGVKPIMDIDTMLVGTQGVSLGVAGIVLTHQTSVMVGIGFPGFMTGPYGYMNTSVAITRGSDAGILRGPMACRQGTVSMGLGAGVGYHLAEAVTGAINAILRALNIDYQLKSFSGIQTPAKIIVNIGRKFPGVEACG